MNHASAIPAIASHCAAIPAVTNDVATAIPIGIGGEAALRSGPCVDRRRFGSHLWCLWWRRARLLWRRALPRDWRRFASPAIAAVYTPIAGLCGASLGAAAVLLTRAATIARPAAAVVVTLLAPAVLSLPGTAAAVLLPAAAVSAGRTLTLGHAFHRIDQCGRNHHSGRDKQ